MVCVANGLKERDYKEALYFINEAIDKANKYDELKKYVIDSNELKEENQVLKQALMAYRRAFHIQFTEEEYIAVNKADEYLWSK